MANDKRTARLLQIVKDYPELTYQNQDYDKLDKSIIDSHKDQIKEIESILDSFVIGFVSFQNFKLRANGQLTVRYQVHYSESFIGVAYTELDALNEWAKGI